MALYQDVSWRRCGVCLVPLLGGLYLIAPNWAIAVSLGLVAIVIPIHEIVTNRTGRDAES